MPVDVRQAYQILAQWLRQFVHWWVGQLLDLLPVPMRRLVDLDPERWVLRAEGPDIRVVRLHAGEDGDAVVAHLALDADPEAPSDEIRNWEQERRADAELTLRLPLALALCRPINLPLAAEENLREVVGFRMDQETPFKADRIYFDYRVLERDAVGKRIALEIVAVPRAAADPYLERLQALGIVPDALDVEDAGGGVNLLPPERRRVRESGIGRLDAILATLGGLLLAAAIAIPLWRDHQTLTGLQARASEVKKKADAVKKLERKFELLTTTSRFLIEKKKTSPVTIAVLAELTRLLPDDAWLYQFELNGKEVLIQGEASASSAIIGLIESSPLFGNVTFRSPVTQNRVTGGERFNLAAEVQAGS